MGNDNEYYFFDEGNGYYHRVDKEGNPIEGIPEPISSLIPIDLEKRIWKEIQ